MGYEVPLAIFGAIGLVWFLYKMHERRKNKPQYFGVSSVNDSFSATRRVEESDYQTNPDHGILSEPFAVDLCAPALEDMSEFKSHGGEFGGGGATGHWDDAPRSDHSDSDNESDTSGDDNSPDSPDSPDSSDSGSDGGGD